MPGRGLGLGLSAKRAGAVVNLGPELVQNGTGAATTGWSTGLGSLAATGSALRLTAASGFGQSGQTVSGLVVGQTYRLTATFAPQEGMYGRINNGSTIDLSLSANGTPATLNFVAAATSLTIYIETATSSGSWIPNGEYVDFTVSLREVL